MRIAIDFGVVRIVTAQATESTAVTYFHYPQMSAATAVRRSVPSSNSDIRMRNNSRGADHTSESSNSQAHATPPSSPVHESARPSRGCCFC
ncbi:hypothetical protein BgiBS90_011905, partial [Biomphalaria glabrata]